MGRRRAGRRVLVIGTLAAVVVSNAAIPATAVVGGFQCDSGNSHFICDVELVGGVEPLTYSPWIVLRNATIQHDNGVSATGTCSPFGPDTKLQVTVTDAAGTQRVVFPTIPCNGGIFT
jgi:hypothetical protein